MRSSPGKKALAGDGKPRSESRRRTEGVFVRLLPVEKLAVEERALAAGMTAPEYLRIVALRDGHILPARRDRATAAAFVRIAYQLSKIGTNINQLAHEANVGHFPAEQGLLAELTELQTLKKAVRAALDALEEPE